MKIRKLKRETSMLNRAESMIHNNATEEQHRYSSKPIKVILISINRTHFCQANSVLEAVPVDGRNLADR